MNINFLILQILRDKDRIMIGFYFTEKPCIWVVF